MARVAVVRTSPQTVVEDYQRLLALAGLAEALPAGEPLALKLNLSWSRYFPASSTPPWQLDAALRALLDAGHRAEMLVAVETRTAYVNPRRALKANRLEHLLAKHHIRFVGLGRAERRPYRSTQPLLVLDRLYPDGVPVPAMMCGRNLLHLATVKTHGLCTLTGAVKNGWGSVLPPLTHHLHKYIQEVLVDLLALQLQLHPHRFAVLDGTVCGDGAGPRTMQPRIQNYLLASSDLLAVDAVAARLMGFDPLSIAYIALAHALGLGCGDPDQIQIVGDDISGVSFGFRSQTNLALWGDQVLVRGPFRGLERLLLHSRLHALVPLISALYHDVLWYNIIGRPRLAHFLRSEWGKVLLSYPV
jgi:uncharacterized protein (DUF362 family)